MITDLDPPVLIFHLLNASTSAGDNVALSCNVNGNPEPMISWIRDGSSLNTDANYRISLSEDKRQLAITNLNTADSGEYRCVAKNGLGNYTSNAAILNVPCKHIHVTC